jgi:OTU domain-containing protein 6
MEVSDTESSTSSSPPINILSSEIKDLRNKIMSVKKSVTKGDKKQKKAIQDELNTLESLLTAKQEELQKLKDTTIANATFNTTTNDINNNIEIDNLTNSISKARLKKERRKEEKAAEWEANRQAALQEIASRPDLALQESKSFDHRLSQEGFRIIEVAADGHCLFSAIGCQLDPPKDHWELRTLAAKYLLNHRGEYENFIELDSIQLNHDSSATDKYQEYCRKLESTGMWGGQIELDVLSRCLGVCVTVLQAEGPQLVFNEEAKQKIYLSYHRFAFSLGEHYNALIKE